MTTVTELQQKSAKLRAFFDQYLPYDRPNPVLADFIRVQHEVMWGGVWLVDGLDLKLRSFATITAQCVNGYDFGVEHQVRTGLTIGITAQQIKGIFIELLFYAGVPATVFGLRIAQEVINEREEWKSDDVPLDVSWLNELEDMLKQGTTFRIQHWGAQANHGIENSLARQMRWICWANSVKVSTIRSGAPSTVPEAMEPANIPTSNPRSSAIRAEIGSNTEAG